MRNQLLKDVALTMHGNEYGNELDGLDVGGLKPQGVVVLFGYSDDNMEFRGAIDEEIGCYDGGEAHLTSNGLLTNECDCEDCPFFEKLKSKAKVIEALWCKEEGYIWTYKTDIPHESFDILKDGEKYCRGIVFYLGDVD